MHHPFWIQSEVPRSGSCLLKTLDTFVIVKDQSYLVYPNMHKIANLWKFSSQLVIKVAREKWKKKTPLLQYFVCLQMHNKRPDSWSFLWFEWECSPLSQKLRHFRGSCFSQCFMLPTALHCSLPSKFLYLQLLWVITKCVHSAFKTADESSAASSSYQRWPYKNCWAKFRS